MMLQEKMLFFCTFQYLMLESATIQTRMAKAELKGMITLYIEHSQFKIIAFLSNQQL